MLQPMRLPYIAAYVVAAALMAFFFFAQNIAHTGPNAGNAPLLLGASAIFYFWASVSLVTGRCKIKGCPDGGFTPEDNPGSFWFGVYTLYGMCGMWLWVSTKM